MTNKSISDIVLATIKKKHITLKPRWTFLLKDYFIWIISVLSLAVGSLAFSVIIFLVKNNDWDVYEYINDSLLQFIILSLPYFWIAFLIIFVLVAHYNFKHTKKGYRFKLHTIVISSVLLSIFFGAILYNIGVGQAIDEVFANKVPYYEKFFQTRKMRWLGVENGFLAGKITDITDKTKFRVVDMSGHTWDISVEKDAIMPLVDIKADNHIRMIGEKISEDQFRAERILPARHPMRNWFRDMPHMKNGLHKRSPVSPEEMPAEAMEKIKEMRREDLEKIGRICAGHEECEVPFFYAARSTCPFESGCIEGKCAVICPDYYDTKKQE